MSGLIWMGLGKALSDVGNTVGGYMAQDIKDEETDRRATERELAAERRQQALLDAKEAKEIAANEREAKIRVDAEDRAKKVGEDRNFTKFAREVGDTSMSPEELRSTYDQFYGDGKETHYLDKYSQSREDVLNELRKGGAKSTTIESAAKDVKEARDAEYRQAELTRKEKADKTREEQGERRLDDQARRTDAAVMAASRAGSSRGETGAKEALSYLRETRLDLKDKETNLRKMMEEEIKSEISPKKKQAIRDSYKPQFDELRAKQEAADADFKAVKERVFQTGGDSIAEKKTAPAVAQKGGQSTVKAGDERVVASGKYAGRTAVFDGTGWKLK